MGTALPIMVSDLPTNIKLLDSSDAGIYVDLTRIDLISEKLEAMLSNPEELLAWGANGKASVHRELSWEVEKEVYLGLYTKLMISEKS